MRYTDVAILLATVLRIGKKNENMLKNGVFIQDGAQIEDDD